MKVAVVGTGRMGSAMVRRLVSVGIRPTVFNRSPEKASRLGVPVAGTPAEAAASADVVLVSLADDAAVRSVYPSLAAGLRSDAVVLETSTVHPSTIRSLRQLTASLLDAPVSGSVPVVERGELTFLVGGEASLLDKARPVLDLLGTKVFHLGALGAGATMKLAVNSAIHGLNQALSEALVLAERAGVDRAKAYDVFEASVVGAPFVHYKRAAFVTPEQAPVAFALELVAKDLALIASLAAESGARMEQLAVNRRIVAEALAEGMGDRDMSSLAGLLRSGSDG
jgi:3-hydroxyisobutyrate dehydrogenase/2-hydroxy-3-oxopropionate reductase